MRRLALAVVPVLLACSEPPTAADTTRAGNPSFEATANLVSETRPMSGEFYNFCTNEWMDISGLIRDRVHSTTLPDGSTKVHLFYNFEAVAIGRVTGKQYRFVGAFSFMYAWQPPQEDVPMTYTTMGMFVGPGPGDNAYMRWLSHWTKNANGDYTVNFGGWTVECR